MRKSFNIYLSLGSNLGDRLANLNNAKSLLSSKIIIHQTSSVYHTPPWGYNNQNAFLNIVLRASTSLPPFELLKFIKSSEVQLGRIPSFKYGPRRIDIDIIKYDTLVINSDHLVIPHPQYHNRAFVLIPLLELDKNHNHPILKSSITELIQHTDTSDITSFKPDEQIISS